jgi:hypothetical protein
MLGAAVASATPALGCGTTGVTRTTLSTSTASDGGLLGHDGSVAAPGPQRATKVDLLFMIANSSTMADRQALLADAVPDLVGRLVNPRCLDGSGQPTGQSADASGTCAAGAHPEFAPVHDLHIGIVDSSLGGRGGDECSPTFNPHDDDRGELVNRPVSGPVDAAPDNFLAWFPPVQENQGQAAPKVTALTTVGDAGTPGSLVGDFTAMIGGVGADGCGFEAQNEAWYRFLVQPDPYDQVVLNQAGDTQRASLVGVDATLLQQRHDFLRPDSLVVVVELTAKEEEVTDPLALAGQGWLFENQTFPTATGTAPSGTIECSGPVDPAQATTTGPYDPKCASCASVPSSDPTFATRCPNAGQLAPADDQLKVRFFHQKQRFGVVAGYPVSRYVLGLTSTTVPDSHHEHDAQGNYVGDNPANANCVNPLFAASLPSSPSDELCALPVGPRSPDLIYYATIAGVPHQLLQVDPTNPDSPQKDALGDADWLAITGRDPEHYDFTGADFHMVESEVPRTAGNLPPGVVGTSSCPPGSPAGCDAINGGEWETNKGDLEYACIYPLAQPVDCSQVAQGTYCDCAAGSPRQNAVLCQTSGGVASTVQVNARAYPSVREMLIARGMGAQGFVSSVCPIHTTPASGDSPRDPLYGYRPAMNGIVNRIKGSLAP